MKGDPRSTPNKRVNDPSELRSLIRSWASSQGVPVRVYFFGSRLKGNNRPDSDLDIAVEALQKFDEYSDFHFWWEDHPHRKWQEDLERATGLTVDLQQYDPKYTENLRQFLAEASEVVFETR